MNLLINIPDEVGNEIKNSGTFCYEDRFNGKTLVAYMHRAIKEGVVLPNNTTNGDVIKCLFPQTVVRDFCKGIKDVSIEPKHAQCFSESWWNAPYKKSEDKE